MTRQDDGNAHQSLCHKLMRADAEADVIRLLSDAGYWEDAAAWRDFGDNPNNFSTIGNQQSRAEAALVEKLVNAVDARLINACRVAGIDPESSAAPRSMREAVARFFEKAEGPLRQDGGRIQNWPSPMRTTEGRLITLAATGFKPDEGTEEGGGYPCFSIADQGEGQTPSMFPRTFLSLNSKNKLNTHFVQGKFNMGGTGALRFCGRHNLQLIVSRRNPALVQPGGPGSDEAWGFTVVRRENPSDTKRSSVYTYLAPLVGEVLRFYADEVGIFPEAQDAYGRASGWGTFLKLYEYETKGFRSNIITSGKGLLRRLDLLMPELALPIRLYECRQYRGKKGSFETNIAGVAVRLIEGADNLEPGFPTTASLTVANQSMPVSIFAFRKGKADDYRMNQGVLFTINGQAHGDLSVAFFERKSVGMSYLANSLFVTVDCTALDGRAREDLFMNSRDRLADGPLKRGIETELTEVLRENEKLRELKNRRRQEEIAERLEDSKPLEDVLKSLLARSPTLANLFLFGKRIPNPFAPKRGKPEEKPYKGQRFPTFFRFPGKPYGTTMERDAYVGKRPRVLLETDATNDYLAREVDPGRATLVILAGSGEIPVQTFSLSLHDGQATLSFSLPDDVSVDQKVACRLLVTDDSRADPFLLEFRLAIKPEPQPGKKRGGGGKKKPPAKDDGNDRDTETLLALPKIIPVKESEWEQRSPPFTRHTALRVKHAGEVRADGSEEGVGEAYDFYINVDNLYLKTEQKRSSEPAELMEQRFTHALVLVGLAIIQEELTRPDKTLNRGEEDEHKNGVESLVGVVTQALAPVMLPMIDALGASMEA